MVEKTNIPTHIMRLDLIRGIEKEFNRTEDPMRKEQLAGQYHHYVKQMKDEGW
jgi:hypothetical protein